jgi:putative chitinase
MPFDHQIYFDSVRDSLFSGGMSVEQVDGQEQILGTWEKYTDVQDMRWLAYMLATAYHETSTEMQPIEEYGHGAGMEYGVPDPETGQTYYGRGFVQLTWRDNYARSDEEIASIFHVDTTGSNSSEWHATLQLDPVRAMLTMYIGMYQGWFRGDSKGKQTLERYFNDATEDPYTAREIINGDKSSTPSWSNGVSIGNLIKGYYEKFLTALHDARIEPKPSPNPTPPPQGKNVEVAITADKGINVVVKINGKAVNAS